MHDTSPGSMDGDWDLTALRGRIRAGRTVILTCGLVTGLAALLLILADGQRYRAEAMLAIARPGAVLQFDARFAPAADNPTFPYQVNSLRVYSELLESAGMARLVGEALTKAGYVGSVDGQDLLSSVRFEALADGALLRIEAAGASPSTAALLAQTWAEVFSAQMTRLYGSAAGDPIRRTRDEAAAALKQAEADLAAGYRQTRLTSLQARLQALRDAHTNRLAAGDRLRATKGDLLALREAPDSGSAARLASLQLALAALTAGAVPSHTLVVQLSFSSADGPTPAELDALAEQIDGRLRTLEAGLSEAEDRLDDTSRDLNAAEATVAELRRDRNLAEERFLTLARKADELAVANATQAPEVRLAGPAMTSDRLPWARYLVWLASAVGLGLLLGLIWVLAVRPRAD